jgi:hypothetical protein
MNGERRKWGGKKRYSLRLQWGTPEQHHTHGCRGTNKEVTAENAPTEEQGSCQCNGRSQLKLAKSLDPHKGGRGSIETQILVREMADGATPKRRREGEKSTGRRTTDQGGKAPTGPKAEAIAAKDGKPENVPARSLPETTNRPLTGGSNRLFFCSSRQQRDDRTRIRQRRKRKRGNGKPRRERPRTNELAPERVMNPKEKKKKNPEWNRPNWPKEQREQGRTKERKTEKEPNTRPVARQGDARRQKLAQTGETRYYRAWARIFFGLSKRQSNSLGRED